MILVYDPYLLDLNDGTRHHIVTLVRLLRLHFHPDSQVRMAN